MGRSPWIPVFGGATSLITFGVVLGAVAPPAYAYKGQRVYIAQADMGSSKQFRPPEIDLNGDGTIRMANVQWTKYNGATGVGSGTWEVNNCKPDCVHGTVTKRPADFTVSKPQLACGFYFYTDLHITWPRAPKRAPLTTAIGPPYIC